MPWFRTIARLFLLCSILAAPACSRGGSEQTPLIGKAAAGDALVWLDLNDNWSLDPEEPQARTSASGDYSFAPTSAVPDTAFVVVSVETGTTTAPDGRLSDTSYLLIASARGQSVSVWTTLAEGILKAGDAADLNEARARVRDAFGLAADFDFAGNSADGLEQAVQTAYGQRYASGVAPVLTPADTVIAAARDVLASSSLILELADLHETPPPAPPGNAQPVDIGIFHGDNGALPVNANMAYGTGFDEAGRSLKSECTTTPEPFLGLCANQYDFTYDLIQHVDELSKHLSVGASASAGVSVAGFDLVSATGEFNFLKDTTDINDGLYILFREEQRLCGYPAVLGLKPEWATQFATAYDTFRNACGDRYLSSLTSGGMFTGLVEVKLKEHESIEDLRLTLSAKVLGVTVFKKSWKDTMHDLSLDHPVRTRVVSNLFAYSDNYLTVDQVFALYDEFTARMQSNGCTGPDGWKTCAYLATFSRYETLSLAPPEKTGAGAVQARLANMQALERYYFETDELIGRVDEIRLDLDDYNVGGNVDGFSQPNDWSDAKLGEWQNTVRGYQQSAVAQWDICRHDIASCTKDPAGLNLPTWLGLDAQLPKRKFSLPQTCAMVAEQFGVTEDGERWLFLGGNVAMNYRAYCKDMATSQPKSYLKLFTTSGNTTDPVDNYSTLRYVDGKGVAGVITRTFDALQIEACPIQASGTPCIQLVAGQADHTAWSVTPDSTSDDTARLAASLDVLEAQAQGTAKASANLNLAGTPLRLSSTLVIAGNSVGVVPVTTVSTDRKKIDISVASGAASADNRIRLEWSGKP